MLFILKFGVTTLQITEASFGTTESVFFRRAVNWRNSTEGECVIDGKAETHIIL